MDTEGLSTQLEVFLKQNEAQADAQAKALGRFSMNFLALEHDMDCMIHELLGLSRETGTAVTSAIMNFSTRLEILYRLASDLPLKKLHRSIILKAVDDAVELNSYRNWLFHSPWVPSARGWSRYFGIPESVDGEFVHTKERMWGKKGKLRQWQRKDFRASEINAQTEHCSEVRSRLNVVLQRFKLNRLGKKGGDETQ